MSQLDDRETGPGRSNHPLKERERESKCERTLQEEERHTHTLNEVPEKFSNSPGRRGRSEGTDRAWPTD